MRLRGFCRRGASQVVVHRLQAQDRGRGTQTGPVTDPPGHQRPALCPGTRDGRGARAGPELGCTLGAEARGLRFQPVPQPSSKAGLALGGQPRVSHASQFPLFRVPGPHFQGAIPGGSPDQARVGFHGAPRRHPFRPLGGRPCAVSTVASHRPRTKCFQNRVPRFSLVKHTSVWLPIFSQGNSCHCSSTSLFAEHARICCEKRGAGSLPSALGPRPTCLSEGAR